MDFFMIWHSIMNVPKGWRFWSHFADNFKTVYLILSTAVHLHVLCGPYKYSSLIDNKCNTRISGSGGGREKENI